MSIAPMTTPIRVKSIAMTVYNSRNCSETESLMSFGRVS
jgi:hypothetical protein